MKQIHTLQIRNNSWSGDVWSNRVAKALAAYTNICNLAEPQEARDLPFSKKFTKRGLQALAAAQHLPEGYRVYCKQQA